MSASKITTAVVLAISVSQTAYAQTDCSQVLKYGIYDIQDTLSSTDKQERFSRHICSDGSSSTGAGGTIVIGGVPIGGSYNADSHSSVCEDVRSHRQLSVRNVKLVKTVNEQLVSAWSQCISQTALTNGLSIWAKEEYDPNWIAGEVRFRNPTFDDNRTSIITLTIPSQVRERSCQFPVLNRARVRPNSDSGLRVEVEVDREASFQFRCQRKSIQPAKFSATNSIVDGIKDVTVRELVLWPRIIFNRQSLVSRCTPIRDWMTSLSAVEIRLLDFAPDQTIYLSNLGGNGHAYNRNLLFSDHNSPETSTAVLGPASLRRRKQSAPPAPRDIRRDGLVISAMGVAPRLLVAVNSRSGCSVDNWASKIRNLQLHFTPAHEGSFVFGADPVKSVLLNDE